TLTPPRPGSVPEASTLLTVSVPIHVHRNCGQSVRRSRRFAVGVIAVRLQAAFPRHPKRTSVSLLPSVRPAALFDALLAKANEWFRFPPRLGKYDAAVPVQLTA